MEIRRFSVGHSNLQAVMAVRRNLSVAHMEEQEERLTRRDVIEILRNHYERRPHRAWPD